MLVTRSDIVIVGYLALGGAEGAAQTKEVVKDQTDLSHFLSWVETRTLFHNNKVSVAGFLVRRRFFHLEMYQHQDLTCQDPRN